LRTKLTQRPEVDPGDGCILLCISRPAANLVLDL
jgi:hypothetical protein